MGFVLFYVFILSIYEHFRDYLKVRKLKRHSKLSRGQIVKEIERFETAWGEWKYIEFLQDENIKPEGDWPDGQLPNIGNDKVTTQLARLEEKWLGLDR